jgi:hypothetical protein
MSHADRYLFIVAEDKQDAIDKIESRLDELQGSEFYDGYEIIEAETKLVPEIPEEFIGKELAGVEDLLRRKHEEAEARCRVCATSGKPYTL